MAKRITIMLEDDIDKKLRLKQSKMIQKEQRSVSFSSVLNSVLKGEIKI